MANELQAHRIPDHTWHPPLKPTPADTDQIAALLGRDSLAVIHNSTARPSRDADSRSDTRRRGVEDDGEPA